MRDGKWAYTIRAYRPTNKGGELVIETLHTNEQSRDAEISVFRERMARGEIDRIDVIAHVEPFDTRSLFTGDDDGERERTERARVLMQMNEPKFRTPKPEDRWKPGHSTDPTEPH